MKYISIFLLFVFIQLYSCRNNTSNTTTANSRSLGVNLTQSDDLEFVFRDINYNDLLLYPLDHKYPVYYTSKINSFEGIPELDSFKIVTFNIQRSPFKYEVAKLKSSKLNQLERFMQENPKNLRAIKSLKYQLNIVNGFKDGKQFILIDGNNNRNFKDDITLEFENTDSLDLYSSVKALDVSYQYLSNDSVFNLKRKIQITPISNHPLTNFYKDYYDVINDQSENYLLNLKFLDYFKGEFEIQNTNYIVALHGITKEEPVIIIKPDSIQYDKSDIPYQKNFRFKVTDTVQLGNNQYSIDSVNESFSRLYLNKIDDHATSPFGYRLGQNIENFELNVLNNGVKDLSSLKSRTKEYTLLYFWGTWCGPCKKISPQLKALYAKNRAQVNLIGVALDESEEEVSRYVRDNKMDWIQCFVDRKNRKGIIRDLKITSYPTFILLNANDKILYRGGFANSMENIETILNEPYIKGSQK